MIKAVFFDIDNTIYSYDKAHAAAMKELLKYSVEKFSVNPDKIKQLLSRSQEIITGKLGINCAAIHNRLIRFQCFLELMHYTDFTVALKMNDIYWNTFLKAMVTYPGIVQLLQSLYTAHIPAGIGSDQNTYIQYKKLETLGILKYFSWIVTSEEAGAEKPDTKFFRLCVEKTGFKPEECAFIGDNIEKDVEGALQNGLYGIWYNPVPDKKSEYNYPVIHSYMDCIEKVSNNFKFI